MDIQTLLIVILAALVVLLTVLLVSRNRTGDSPRTSAPDESFFALTSLLQASAADGSIARVAGAVSDLLKGPLGCDRILFLRKQRGFLELNFYHALRGFKRNQFRVRYSDELSAWVRQEYAPRASAEMAQFLPPITAQALQQFELETFFPVFWRDNLYGIYFISRPRHPQAAEALSVLAHMLSSAYHVKWHEARYDRLARKASLAPPTPATADQSDTPLQRRVLKLVRHRNSETLVPKLIDTIQEEIGVRRLAYLYEQRVGDDTLALHVTGGISIPGLENRSIFLQLVGRLDPHVPYDIEQLETSVPEAADWLRELRTRGVRQLSRFEVRNGRHGLLMLWRTLASERLFEHLQRLQPAVTELVHNAEVHEKYEELSYTDALTGLANQRYFRKRLDEEISRARRYQRSLALIIFDLDGLKAINDQHGHQAGDEVLRQMGCILKHCIRAIDIVSRYGGDEFCVIMPEADYATCRQLMQRLQETIGREKFVVENLVEPISCTISQGAALFPIHADNQTDLIFHADMALLKAKASGRNHFLIHREPVAPSQP